MQPSCPSVPLEQKQVSCAVFRVISVIISSGASTPGPLGAVSIANISWAPTMGRECPVGWRRNCEHNRVSASWSPPALPPPLSLTIFPSLAAECSRCSLSACWGNCCTNKGPGFEESNGLKSSQEMKPKPTSSPKKDKLGTQLALSNGTGVIQGSWAGRRRQWQCLQPGDSVWWIEFRDADTHPETLRTTPPTTDNYPAQRSIVLRLRNSSVIQGTDTLGEFIISLGMKCIPKKLDSPSSGNTAPKKNKRRATLH